MSLTLFAEGLHGMTLVKRLDVAAYRADACEGREHARDRKDRLYRFEERCRNIAERDRADRPFDIAIQRCMEETQKEWEIEDGR